MELLVAVVPVLVATAVVLLTSLDYIHIAEELAEEMGFITSNAKWPYTCIDWERAARDLMYDYFQVDGHYFHNY